ncbi:MAG: hypothetical protein EOO46_23310, partial [Flavobacterium sp.]
IAIPFRDKNLWGLSDTLGKIVVKPFAKEIKDFLINEDGAFDSRYVIKTNKTYYVIDRNKKVYLPELNTYDSIKLKSNHPNHFWVYKKGLVGLFHKNKEIIPCLYEKVVLTYNDSYIVKKGQVLGLINSLGKLIIPMEYLDISQSWEKNDYENPKFVWIAKGMLVEKNFYDSKIVKKDNDYGSDLKMSTIDVIEEKEVDRKTEALLLKKYDAVQIYSNSIAYVTKNGKKGIVDIFNQEEIIYPIYEEVITYRNKDKKTVYKVKHNGKYGLIQAGNKTILNCEFDAIDYDGVIVKDSKRGMIVLNTIYPYIEPKYNTIKEIKNIKVKDDWWFGLFEVTTEKGKGLVGENGVEFFKD